MNRSLALLGVPVLLALHNLEEALTIEAVLPMLRERAPDPVRAALPLIGVRQFLLALLVVSVLAFAVALWGSVARPGTTRGYLLLVVQATVLVNVVWHVTAGVVIGGYTPGLVTAVLVNLPWSIYLLGRAAREQWHGRAALWALLPAAILLHGPALVGLLALSAGVVRMRA
jgi:hypothetical protein